MTKSKYLATLILTLLVSSALAQGKDGKRPRFESVSPDHSISGVVDARDGGEYWSTYNFEVPENTVAFRLWLSGAEGDLDLYAQYGAEIEDYSETEWYSEQTDWNEQLFAYSLYGESFEAGTWFVDVAYQLDNLPRDERGRVLEELPFELHVEFLALQIETELRPDEPVSVTLSPEWDAISWFELDVPDDINALRIDVFDTGGDIDLLLTKDPFGNFDAALVVSQSLEGSETLIYEPEEGVLEGVYYLIVLDPFVDLDPIELSLLMSYSIEAPIVLQEPIPPMNQERGPHGAPIGATVQIIADSGWGTGNIVSADGWILTNDHVVRGPDGDLVESVVVAVVGDTGHPPKETFRARVVSSQEHPDLALLKIEEGLYGQPIPAEYNFPHWQWGDSSSVDLGDAVYVVGFPSVGGSGSRPIFTFTRGYLAGRELNSNGSTLVTDTLISGGSSGGALTTGNGQLLALPSFTIDDEGSQMSFALSLDQVPDEWKRQINLD